MKDTKDRRKMAKHWAKDVKGTSSPMHIDTSTLHQADEGEFDGLHAQQMWHHTVDSSCVNQL